MSEATRGDRTVALAEDPAAIARCHRVMRELRPRHDAEAGCVSLTLDPGVQRFGAHRFYLRKGMDIGSHHFGMKLDALRPERE